MAKRRGKGSTFEREGREGTLCMGGRGRGGAIKGAKVSWAEKKSLDSRRLSWPIKALNKKIHNQAVPQTAPTVEEK
jgi:hypothetical protein